MSILKSLICENEKLALNKVMAAGSWLIWAVATIGMIVAGTGWEHYDTFTFACCGTGTVVGLGNHGINSAFNTRRGSFSQDKEG